MSLQWCHMARQFSPEKFQQTLTELGVSQRKLGRMMHPGDKRKGEQRRTVINSHIQGRANPTMETVQRYADALGVPVEDISVEVDDIESELDALRRRLDELEVRAKERRMRRRAA